MEHQLYNPVTNRLERVRTPTVWKTVALSNTGNLWDPGSSKRFRLMKITIQIPEDATISNGAELLVKLQDGSGNDIGIAYRDYLGNSAQVCTKRKA